MYKIDKQKFGAFIASLRKEKKLTQKDLAQKLYISDKAVSKWETGVSIPDTALLIPLGEALGVTVTELLECRRIEHSESLTAGQVEQLVQTTIQLSAEEEPPLNRVTRIGAYLGCVLGAAMELLFLHFRGFTIDTWSECLQLCVLFGVLLGGYFMVFAKPRLPDYYDQNKINGMIDGPFRMNLPGLALNNRNWPHILTVGRAWSMTFLLGYPMLYMYLYSYLPGFWPKYEEIVMVTLLLGGLFVPVYAVGKKYE